MLKGNDAALEYLRLMQAHWERYQDTFGDTYNATLCRLVMIGWMEGRPQDITSLAAGLKTSRQQATRRCVSMSEAGWVKIDRRRNHVVVMPTDKLIELSEVEIPKSMAVGMARWRKIAAIAATAAALSVTPEVQPSAATIQVVDVAAIEVVEERRQVSSYWMIPIRGRCHRTP